MTKQSFTPLLGTHTFDISWGYINNSLDAIRAHWEGSSEPPSGQLYQYQLWVDTGNNLLKMRNAANDGWIVIGEIGVQNLGLVSFGNNPGGASFSQNLDMGGYQLSNLGLGTGTQAARMTDIASLAPLAAPALTGDATINQDPAGPNSIARKSWLEATFLKLGGGVMTGNLQLPAAATPGAAYALRRDFIESMDFDAATGHDHDGVTAKQIDHSDILNVPAFLERTTGTYTGDGTNNRHISLGFRAAIVIITQSGTESIFAIGLDPNIAALPGIAATDDGLDTIELEALYSVNRGLCPEIDATGFWITKIDGKHHLNKGSETFYYIALH